MNNKNLCYYGQENQNNSLPVLTDFVIEAKEKNNSELTGFVIECINGRLHLCFLYTGAYPCRKSLPLKVDGHRVCACVCGTRTFQHSEK